MKPVLWLVCMLVWFYKWLKTGRLEIFILARLLHYGTGIHLVCDVVNQL